MDNGDKDELINEIRKWIGFDEEIKGLQKKIRQIRQEKKQSTNTLVDIMRNNDIGEINISDGKLIYTQQKIRNPFQRNTLLIFYRNTLKTTLKAQQTLELLF